MIYILDGENLEKRMAGESDKHAPNYHDEAGDARLFHPVELKNEYDRGYRDAKEGRKYSPPGRDLAAGKRHADLDALIGADEVKAALAFESAAKKLLNDVEDTIADLKREGQKTRDLMKHLGLSSGSNG